MPSYVEFICTSVDCENYGEIWDAYVKQVDGDGGVEYIACSDGPATELRDNTCPECGETGERI